VVVDLREIHLFGFRGIAALIKIHHHCQQRHLDLRVLANSSMTRILQSAARTRPWRSVRRWPRRSRPARWMSRHPI